MLQKFSTLKITFVLLVGLIASLLAGVFLTFDKHHAAAMKFLSKQLPLTWLMNESGTDGVLTAWFVTVCLIAGIFFIQIICCLLMRSSRLFRNGFSLKQWMFFLLHIMFVLVMLCHGLSMILGYKHSGVRLLSGQVFSFGEGWTVTPSDVRFSDDPAILKASYQQQRSLMTRENIHRHQNHAEISLEKEGQLLSSGRIYMLAPMQYGSVRITLTDFFISENEDKDVIGVKLVISKNLVTPYFFSAYAAMILTLIVFIVITWRNGKTAGNALNNQEVPEPI